MIAELTTKVKNIYFSYLEIPFKSQLLEDIEFSVKINSKKLDTLLDSYLDLFINDELVNPNEIEENWEEDGTKTYSHNTRYYPYNLQRLALIHLLRKETREYGYTNLTLLGEILYKAEFRKFETILLAKRDGLLKSKQIGNNDDYPLFNINKSQLNQLIKEHKADLREFDKKIKLYNEDPFGNNSKKITSLKYSPESKVLTVQNKEIRINKTTKDTYQTLLLECLFSYPQDKHFDYSIWETFDKSEEFHRKNRTIDTTRRAINKKVQKELGNKTDEFLLGNDSWVQVNPSYF